MSDLPLNPGAPHTIQPHRSLWPVAAVILLVVFVPALIAWGFTMLKP